ncbi:MAG: OstA-like protein, partial [Spirosomataceae bacterium]
GTYNTRTKIFNYIGDVEIKSPTILLCTDTLDYNSNTYDAFFQSKTTITSANGVASANKGQYNTKSKVSKFQGRSSMASATYVLEADTLAYDEKSQLGVGKGHVRFESFKDSVTIFSKKGIRKGDIGETYMDGDALLIRITNSDSLFIQAKHFITYEKVNNTKKTDEKEFKLLIAHDSVRVWRRDFQSVSDSLRYDLVDSTIYFLTNPILWGKNNQMKADTIVSFLENNKLRKINLITNGFVIAPDTAQNYNQVSAREITAYLSKQDGSLEKVLANGNGETLYFALDDNQKMIGLNRVESSEMRIDFQRNEVQIIRFSGNPDAKLSPPKVIDLKEARLEKFELFEVIRPLKPELSPLNVK